MKSKIILLILFLSIFLNIYFLTLSIKNNTLLKDDFNEQKKDVGTVKDNEKNKNARVLDSIGDTQKQFIFGTIKKEIIPSELELGDYWYWVHFDEPYLLVNNAAGVPMYIDKIQLNPSLTPDFYPIEDFLNTPVEIFGYQTWGYAESSVFQIVSIRKLN